LVRLVRDCFELLDAERKCMELVFEASISVSPIGEALENRFTEHIDSFK